MCLLTSHILNCGYHQIVLYEYNYPEKIEYFLQKNHQTLGLRKELQLLMGAAEIFVSEGGGQAKKVPHIYNDNDNDNKLFIQTKSNEKHHKGNINITHTKISTLQRSCQGDCT